VADWPARVRPAEIDVPQELTGLRVERDEVAFHAAPEDEITGRREHARLGVVHHLEIPLLLARLRIERADCSVPLVLFLEGGIGAGLPAAADWLLPWRWGGARISA